MFKFYFQNGAIAFNVTAFFNLTFTKSLSKFINKEINQHCEIIHEFFVYNFVLEFSIFYVKPTYDHTNSRILYVCMFYLFIKLDF